VDRGQPSVGPDRPGRGERGILLGAAGLGWLCGWLATSPGLSLGINWDTAAYAAEIASGRLGWSSPPWSSHYALGPLYVTGAGLGRLLGGTVLDGFRLLSAFALAATAVLVARAARWLAGSRSLALGVVASWLAWWGLLRLACTWEDNILFLPLGAAALVLAIERATDWRPRDGLAAGALAGAGSLVSWQAAVYLLAPLYAAIAGQSLAGKIAGSPARRPAARRLAEVLLIPLAFLAVRVAWALVYALTSRGLSPGSLLATLFARPEPSFFPRGLHGWAELASAWRAVLRHVAAGVLQVLGPWWREGSPRGAALLIAGAAVLAGALAAAVVTGRWARRSQVLAGHLIAATTAALLVASALYVDLPVDKYKRYDFLPLLLSLALAAALGRWRSSPRRRWLLLAPLLALQVTLAGFTHARFRAALAAARPAGYHTRDGETWFAFARHLRARTRDRCGYLFTFAEVQHARYQLEIPAALWSELPGARVLDAPPEAASWRRPLPLAPAPVTLRGCEWLSPDAELELRPPLR
jgi:hypothetical protein